jgi:curli biogenesis system outer membrane secretion channel CsgG
MKNQFLFLGFLKFSISLLFCSFVFMVAAQKVDVELETVKAKCKDKKYEERVRVTVARFSSSTPKAYNEFGGELATMLTNALQGINCFRVLESLKNATDLNDEIAYGQSGNVNSGSAAKVGNQLGAQVIFTGEITEFSEGENSFGLLGVKVGQSKAKVGFIVKAINPETREIYFSQSIETESAKPGGFSGVKILGIEMAGGKKQNAAIADAVERGIIKAAYVLADQIDKIPLPKANNGTGEKRSWNAGNCPLLSSGKAPSIMVILPEKYNNTYYNQKDMAAESEMIKSLIEAGFTVIDPSMFAAIRKGAKFNAALNDPLAAASLGNEFGAGVVVVGEAISNAVGQNGAMISSRASVSIKAIRTDNAAIIATNNAEAGGADISAQVSHRVALKNAGSQAADYILERLCSNAPNVAFASANNGGGAKRLTTTRIKVTNTNFPKLKNLTDMLTGNSKVQEVTRSLNGSEAVIEVKHEGTSDSLLDFISEKGDASYEVIAFEGNQIQIAVK